MNLLEIDIDIRYIQGILRHNSKESLKFVPILLKGKLANLIAVGYS